MSLDRTSNQPVFPLKTLVFLSGTLDSVDVEL